MLTRRFPGYQQSHGIWRERHLHSKPLSWSGIKPRRCLRGSRLVTGKSMETLPLFTGPRGGTPSGYGVSVGLYQITQRTFEQSIYPDVFSSHTRFIQISEMLEETCFG